MFMLTDFVFLFVHKFGVVGNIRMKLQVSKLPRLDKMKITIPNERPGFPADACCFVLTDGILVEWTCSEA